MSETKYSSLTKNQRVAVFVAVTFTFFIFIVPSFDLTQYAPDSSGFMQRLSVDDGELRIYEIRAGEGAAAETGDQLSVHYEARFVDGTLFASSYDSEPFSFVLGEDDTALIWNTGLIGMQEGAIRILVVPSQLGSGILPLDTAPVDNTFILEIELLSVERR